MKPQEKLKNKKNAIQVAYFWNKKDPSKIDLIMTKTQKFIPEEKIIKDIKAKIRKINKLPFDIAGINEEQKVYIERGEVLKIMGDQSDNKGQKNLQRKSQPKRLQSSGVPKKGRRPDNKSK